MTVKYANRNAFPVSVYVREVAQRSKMPGGGEYVTYQPAVKVTLEGGKQGVLSDGDFSLVKNDKTIRAMVAEGTLAFPGNKDMRAIAGTKAAELIARQKRLSQEQDERKEQGEVDRDKDAQIATLEKSNADMAERLGKVEKMLAEKSTPTTTKAAAGNTGGNA